MAARRKKGSGQLSESGSDSWRSFGLRLAASAACHPMDYARTLMQLGYEPIPPRPSKTIFGRPTLLLPNIFQYVAYIKRQEGLIGCYRGVVPRVLTNLVNSLAHQKVVESFKWAELSESEGEEAAGKSAEEEELDEAEAWALYFRNAFRDLVARLAAIVASHPFQVVTIRCMAQFIGGEEKYTGFICAVKEVYRENGVGGFFQGVFPRLLGEVAVVGISTSMVYLINSYVVRDKEVRTYMHPCMSFFANAFTYPCAVVSTCMAVNNSGLAVSRPPYMMSYTSSSNCYRHLSKINQLKRGGSMFFRYYTGPFVVMDGKPMLTSALQVSGGRADFPAQRFTGS